MELLPFVDILKVFNNPINEEQAWAVCYQCAHFLQRNPSQEFYQDVYDSGLQSIWLSRHGDVLLRKGPPDPNGSGKGPPQHSSSRHHFQPHHHHSTPTSPSSSSTTTTTTTNNSSFNSSSSYTSRTTTTSHHRVKGHVLATETDAVQALGTAIFEALDYGIDQSEERQLSPELENMIVTMTNTSLEEEEEDEDAGVDPDYNCDEAASSNGDDEGIEKDADVETRCTVLDVIKLCVRHLSSKQDASHHYKAVCRALATEAGELFTFLDKVAAGKEQLSQTEDEDAKRLEELQRADWACLWVQVMRSLRQGVRLKKVEHVHLPPLEYELTPFEMILEDIRSRRYTLTKIMVNGDIPHKVKNDAHAVILNFIRSRPPLKKVDERKLKPKPPSPPDPHELLLNEIRSRPKLRPVRAGRLVVEKSHQLSGKSRGNTTQGGGGSRGGEGAESEEDLPSGARTPAKKVIKPDFNLLLNNSFEESSDDEDRSSNNSPGTPEFRYPLYRRHKDSAQQQQEGSAGGDQHYLQQQHPHLYPRSDSLTMTPPPRHSWQRAVTRETLLRDPSQQLAASGSARNSRLQRRHTITICEAPLDPQVAMLQELPVLQEEEEEQQPSPSRDWPGGIGAADNSAAANSFGGGSSASGLYQVRQAVLPRSSLSDNDLQGLQAAPMVNKSTATIVLRQPNSNPALVRRASFEHRRSFSNQGSAGLTSIPEQEDDGKSGGASNQDSNPRALARARSEEQCPPPNPSPPCKGRAKAGLAMVGMKPIGGPYHPTTSYQSRAHHHHPSNSSNNNNNTTATTTIIAPTTSVAPPVPAKRSSVSNIPLSSPDMVSSSMQHAHSSYSSISSTAFTPKSLQSQHAPSASSSSSLSLSRTLSGPSSISITSSPSYSPSSSSSVQSQQPVRSASLDLGSSIQSPAYRNSSQGYHGAGQRISRWRHPVANSGVEEDEISNTATNVTANDNSTINSGFQRYPLTANRSSPRRWVSGISRESSSGYESYESILDSVDEQEPLSEIFDNRGNHETSNIAISGYYPTSLSPDEIRNKRLSLDSGMSMYYDEALRQDNADHGPPPSSSHAFEFFRELESGPKAPVMSRRSSVGLDRGVRGRAGFRRLKTPEEEERVTRWKALQEDDRQARLNRLQPQHEFGPREEFPSEHDDHVPQGSPALSPRLAHSRRTGFVAPPGGSRPTPLPRRDGRFKAPEVTDVLQKRMADEEARFERWRRLEEGTGSHPLLEHLDIHQDCGSPGCSRKSSPQTRSPQVSARHQSGSPGSTSPHRSSSACMPSASSSSTTSNSMLPEEPVETMGVPILHDSFQLQKRWQNPVECLSLTLEEVTHIRSVLTKAELESLISHPDLYQQVAKSKLCFTCKTTRFALFGEWGTKCKFCKRTVCSKCLRKMNVPADHFRNIPVYALNPTPLTQEMQDFIQDVIRGAPAPSVPATREHSPARQAPTSSELAVPGPGAGSKSGLFSGPAKALQRSQSAMVAGPKSKLKSFSSSTTSGPAMSLSGAIKGPVMAICCDCKGMVMEIIRATRASLTLISTPEGRASLASPAQAASSTAASFSSPSAQLNHSAKQYLAARSKMISN